MAGISLKAINRLGDPVPLWRFECELPDIGTVAKPEKARIQKISVPFATIADEQVFFGGNHYTFPDSVSYDAINITALESGSDTPLSVMRYFDAWRKLAIDDDYNHGLPIDYWKTLVIKPVGFTGKALGSLKLENCWPKQINQLDFDGENSAIMWISVTLACTKLKMEF